MKRSGLHGRKRLLHSALKKGIGMSLKRRYITATILDAVIVFLICLLVMEIIFLGDWSTKFIDWISFGFSLAIILFLLFRDIVIGFATRRLFHIEFQPVPRWWQYILKNIILSLAAGCCFLTHDIYEMIVGGPAKGPYWLGYIETVLPFILFILDSYFLIGLRAAGIELKERKTEE